MRTTSLLTVAWFALEAVACKASDPSARAGAPATVESSTPPADSTTAPQPPPSATAARDKDGKLPFDYPATPIAAQPGDMVLAPPRQWLDNAIAEGVDKQPFVFFRAELLEPGRHGSLVKTPSGRLEEIPNAVIIPIRRGEHVKPGEVVLTAWQQGTGLQRGMVIKGGTPDRPRVHYLDLKYKHPSGLGKASEVLAPNTFHRLNKPGEVGTSVACRDGSQYRHYIVVNVSSDSLIGLGFAGRLRVLDRKNCQLLDITPHINDTPLFVPVMGVFRKARVRHYEEELGRVFVRYTTGGEDHEEVFGIVNVTRELEPATNP